jgi:A/G-specific adenine glycosylase
MLRSPRLLAPALLRWYDTVQGNRDMPWRQTRDPYAIWLSETMLQQTQVATVKPYYARFLERFPTIAQLAAADLDSVLALWAGLGYYRRARHLHAAARHMVAHHGGRVPASLEALLELPGVGRYTAGAVASIAFGIPAPVVDGNVMRVIARLTGFDKNIADPKNAPFFWERAQEILGGGDISKRRPRAATSTGAAREARYGDINQALMELGATICLPPPGQPACLLCPARSFCRAFAEGRQQELPVKVKRGPTPEVHGISVIVTRRVVEGAGGKAAGVRHGASAADRSGPREVLLFRRPSQGVWADMWEFPVLAGRLSEDLAPLRTRLEKLLGLALSPLAKVGQVTHQLTHRTMHYDVVVAGTADRAMPAAPACPEGGEYADGRWLPWPLAPRPEIPCARIVHRIAQLACAQDSAARQPLY